MVSGGMKNTSEHMRKTRFPTRRVSETTVLKSKFKSSKYWTLPNNDSSLTGTINGIFRSPRVRVPSRKMLESMAASNNFKTRKSSAKKSTKTQYLNLIPKPEVVNNCPDGSEELRIAIDKDDGRRLAIDDFLTSLTGFPIRASADASVTTGTVVGFTAIDIMTSFGLTFDTELDLSKWEPEPSLLVNSGPSADSTNIARTEENDEEYYAAFRQDFAGSFEIFSV